MENKIADLQTLYFLETGGECVNRDGLFTDNYVQWLENKYNSQFTPTATDEKEIEALAKEYLFNDFQNKYVVDTNDVQFGVLKGFIAGYTQALQSRVVNVSDLEVEKYLRAGIRLLCDEKCDCHAECKKEDENYKTLFSKLSFQSEKEMDEFAVSFAEWIRKNEYLYTSFENHWYKSHGDNLYTDFTESQLLTIYKESITVKK